MRSRRGRQNADLPADFFIVGPSGWSNPGGNPPQLNARSYDLGVNDGDLPAELFDVIPQGTFGMGCQEQCQPGIQRGRTPTPEWEMGLLGLGNSRQRDLDAAPNSDLAIWRIGTRPFRDEVSGPWIQQFLITQEVYRQFNGSNAERWEEESNA